jgi:hypothetical protein
MADEKTTGAWGSSLVVVAFAAVSAVYVAWQPAPLVSSRPSEIGYPHELLSRQDIDARLWEDPIAAVMRDIETRRSRAPSASGDHTKTGFDHPHETTLVLGVTLPGASYPEVAETRRRLRYAVLSALHVAGFTPTDEKHIGYWRPTGGEKKVKSPQTEVRIFQNDWPGASDAAASGAPFEPDLGIGIAIRTAAGAVETRSDAAQVKQPLLPAIVPWEEFDQDQKHVLVLWLDEDFLTAGRRPIASLVALQRKPGYPPGSLFALLGPEDSTMLGAMVNEAWNPTEADPANAGFPVYNFGATAEDRQIVGDDKRIGDELKKVGIELYYPTINTDAKLAQALACELMRRDPNLGLNGCAEIKPGTEQHDHVVLLSDWDTVYGKDLNDTAATTFGGTKNVKEINSEWIRQVSYLRGLDGRPPDPKHLGQTTPTPQGDSAGEAPGQDPAAQQKAATPDTANLFESAEGPSQLDYLRRLAADLKERDARYRRDGSHIAAIGVLGSDVYDKLLILQALRPELPEALFFTTDLDELLLPQKKARYTRDLLVASSFDLRLNDRLQRDIPPFRNTYQTSFFLAAQLAIQNELRSKTSAPAPNRGNAAAVQKVADRAPAGAACDTADAAADADKSACRREIPASWLAQPLLFQIGRTAAQPLLPQKADVSCDPGNIFDCQSIQPSAGALYPDLGPGARASAAGILTILLLGFAFSTRLVRSQCFPTVPHGDGVTQSVNPRIGPLLGALAGTAIVSAAFWWKWPIIADYLTGYGSGEPMALLEGISLWPSILLRALGILLALSLVCGTLCNLEGNLRETEREMSLARSQETLCEEWSKIKGDMTAFPNWASRIAALLWLGSLPRAEGYRPRVRFEDLMGKFAIRWPARCIRALIATLLMFWVWAILSGVFGEPNIPSRGSFAGSFFRWITGFEVLFTVFLIFVVADATLLSRAFIKRLTAVETIWPGTTLSIFQGRFHLDGAHLADWIDMHYLARRTRSITGIIYFPFIALAVLAVSRSALFDDFATAWTIVITQALSAAIVIGSAIALRLTAEKARAVACEHITAHIIAAKDGKADRLEKLLDGVKNLSDGAFAPWTSQPVARAVLLPLITYGGTLLLHLYALPGM